MTAAPNPQQDPKQQPSADQISIQTFALGPYQTNCFILRGPTSCVLIDCGMEPEAILDRVSEIGLPLTHIVLTHAHIDHIAGLFEARRRFPDAVIWIHEAEEDWLTDPMKNLSGMTPTPVTAPTADRLLKHGETIELAGASFEVRHTPGHSPGSISLINHANNIAFVGDALFNGSIGRTDFPGSSLDTLEQAIRTQLYTLEPATIALPGHGPRTTIGHEMATNPFVPGAK